MVSGFTQAGELLCRWVNVALGPNGSLTVCCGDAGEEVEPSAFTTRSLGRGGGVVSSGHHTDRRVKMTLTKKRNILPLQLRFAACMTARIYATAALILAAAAACGSRGQVDGA